MDAVIANAYMYVGYSFSMYYKLSNCDWLGSLYDLKQLFLKDIWHVDCRLRQTKA